MRRKIVLCLAAFVFLLTGCGDKRDEQVSVVSPSSEVSYSSSSSYSGSQAYYDAQSATTSEPSLSPAEEDAFSEALEDYIWGGPPPWNPEVSHTYTMSPDEREAFYAALDEIVDE